MCTYINLYPCGSFDYLKKFNSIIKSIWIFVLHILNVKFNIMTREIWNAKKSKLSNFSSPSLKFKVHRWLVWAGGTVRADFVIYFFNISSKFLQNWLNISRIFCSPSPQVASLSWWHCEGGLQCIMSGHSCKHTSCTDPSYVENLNQEMWKI